MFCASPTRHITCRSPSAYDRDSPRAATRIVVATRRRCTSMTARRSRGRKVRGSAAADCPQIVGKIVRRLRQSASPEANRHRDHTHRTWRPRSATALDPGREGGGRYRLLLCEPRLVHGGGGHPHRSLLSDYRHAADSRPPVPDHRRHGRSSMTSGAIPARLVDCVGDAALGFEIENVAIKRVVHDHQDADWSSAPGLRADAHASWKRRRRCFRSWSSTCCARRTSSSVGGTTTPRRSTRPADGFWWHSRGRPGSRSARVYRCCAPRAATLRSTTAGPICT